MLHAVTGVVAELCTTKWWENEDYESLYVPMYDFALAYARVCPHQHLPLL